jgi:hypothetical protein
VYPDFWRCSPGLAAEYFQVAGNFVDCRRPVVNLLIAGLAYLYGVPRSVTFGATSLYWFVDLISGYSLST